MSTVPMDNAVRISANDQFKAQYNKYLRWSALAAILLTLIAWMVSPTYTPNPYKLRQEEFEVVDIEDQEIIEGLAKSSLPGRMETINENPRILVDGAHNAASVEALMRAVGQNIPYDSMVVIFGCRSDKDIPGMLRHIQLGADKVIFTDGGAPRSADASELAAEYVERCGKMTQVAESLEEALDIAERAVTREDVICITGSFYLVGKAKRVVAERYSQAVTA